MYSRLDLASRFLRCCGVILTCVAWPQGLRSQASQCSASQLESPRPSSAGQADQYYIEGAFAAVLRSGTLQVGLPVWWYDSVVDKIGGVRAYRGLFWRPDGKVDPVLHPDSTSGWASLALSDSSHAELFWAPADFGIGPPPLYADEIRAATFSSAGWSPVRTLLRGEQINALSMAAWTDTEDRRAVLAVPLYRRMDSLDVSSIFVARVRGAEVESDWITLEPGTIAPRMVTIGKVDSLAIVTFLASRGPKPGSWGIHAVERDGAGMPWAHFEQLRRFGDDSSAMALRSVTTANRDHHVYWLDTRSGEARSTQLSHRWRVSGESRWRSETITARSGGWKAITESAYGPSSAVLALTTVEGGLELLVLSPTGARRVRWLGRDFQTRTDFRVANVRDDIFSVVLAEAREATDGVGLLPVSSARHFHLECTSQ